ncbi:hypothetical protein IEO21_10959 [Rhodonia placenta]|uniref:Uncharacterized protein n=1 Tax=Rhodonia placenta TaxID=104341 RepID=A0A8H7TVH6_9APHY|nr:hypothetical protein IEO21_10959 [Postia placenta]
MGTRGCSQRGRSKAPQGQEPVLLLPHQGSQHQGLPQESGRTTRGWEAEPGRIWEGRLPCQNQGTLCQREAGAVRRTHNGGFLKGQGEPTQPLPISVSLSHVILVVQNERALHIPITVGQKDIKPEIHLRALTSDRTPSPTHPCLQHGWNPEQRSTHHAKSSLILQDKQRTPICQSLRRQHRQGRHHLRPHLAQARKPQDRLENGMS